MNDSKPKADTRSARDQIDGLDQQLVTLLAQRMQAVAAVGAAKSRDPNRPVFDPDREHQVAARWRAQAQEHGLSEYFVGRVLHEVLAHSHRGQEQQRRASGGREEALVGYQGVAGAFSDAAIDKLFATRGVTTIKRGYATFVEVVDALLQSAVDHALLPIENSTCGSVAEVSQLLTTRGIAIVDEEYLAVEHCIAVVPGATLDQVRELRSHPVALLQCQQTVAGLHAVRAVPHFDTAAAASHVAELADEKVAAICSAAAARLSGLEIVRRDVADQADNQTRFVLLARAPEQRVPAQPVKTSLLFEVQNRQGALLECLQGFAAHGCNLTRLESRILPGKPWQYGFVADVQGGTGDAPFDAAIATVSGVTAHLRILGCYPDRAVARAALPVAHGSLPAVAIEPPRPAAANAALPRVSHSKSSGRSLVSVGSVAIGGDGFTLIAGPCAVEDAEQIADAARLVRKCGAQILRGGVFKPRSSPYSFQGLGAAGLELLADAGRSHGMPVVTEALRVEDLDLITAHADMIQIGARNMQNFALLKAVGQRDLPVLLKRGMSATIDELLGAAEYIMAEGNHRVVLCERGIRTFERATRATLDVSAVPVLKERTHLPVIVDPSHAAGRRELVVPLALAAVAAGADGLIVEAHPRPEEARCDKEQALTAALMAQLAAGASAIISSRGGTWPAVR